MEFEAENLLLLLTTALSGSSVRWPAEAPGCGSDRCTSAGTRQHLSDQGSAGWAGAGGEEWAQLISGGRGPLRGGGGTGGRRGD